MGQVCWPASADGRYWIDIAVGNQPLRCMIDTGLVDPLDQIGLDLDQADYDRLTQLGCFTGIQWRSRRDAGGRRVRVESARAVVQLLDPNSQQPILTPVFLWACRGTLGVPSRIGVVFFHKLSQCHVNWDLNNRQWCVVYP